MDNMVIILKHIKFNNMYFLLDNSKISSVTQAWK